MNKKKKFFLRFFLFTLSLNSQIIKLKGKVSDSDNNLLPYATIIADSNNSEFSSYSVSDEKGNFNFKLKKNRYYIITANYLGFKPKTIRSKFSKDSILNFKLDIETEKLDEVSIKYTPPIIVKKDTIIYKIEKFATGEERKLKDVLKKLPGVEVDKAGNVTVQGKRVTKVLVENKQFFTGDSKLAVNNIPADAINQVEVLDNYNDVALLKGLEDSNDMAMNIKLKEDKKNFWFGDIEAGSGIGLSKRHLIHPSIFYYSPKTSINLIGDVNNTGKKSFTFKDYLDFEGGYKKILLDPKAYFSKLNDDFSQFLTNQDFKNSNHIFGGASLNYSINSSTDLIGYSIYSKSDNELESQNINEYINESNLIEKRTTTNNPINDFIITKIGIERKQKDGGKLKVNSFLKSSDNINSIKNISTLNGTTNYINTLSHANNIDFKQDIEWHKSLSKNHTFTSIANFNYGKGETLVNWNTNNNIFQSIIPIINDSSYSIFKNKETSSLNFSALLKHYWVLGNFVHLYTTGGSQFFNDKYYTNEFQKVSDGTVNDFNSSNFGNDIDFNFNNFYIGSHLKFQKGKFTFKPGIFFHNYQRKTKQNNQNLRLQKNYILPELSIKIDLKRSEKINIKYNRKVRFPSLTKLLNSFTLTNFNSIYIGNPTLENELYHQASIYYYKFSLFKKLNYNFNLRYRKNEKGVKNRNNLEGINFITQPILLDNSDESINFSGNINKRYGDYKISLGVNTTFLNYLQQLNNEIFKNKSESFSFNTSVKTNFLKFPNFSVNYKKEFNNYKSQGSLSKFENDFINLNIEYDFWDDFIFNLNYNFRDFKNKNINSTNRNDILNTSLFYQKENSPWGIEITANNLFDNQFIRNSSFNDFLISDNRKFILPRILLLKISYKL
ncbi:carboxypeptidase regulatory-like domain-containing protein [Tenacibaculum aiptasiae]|uniref:Carboxypeptidase regulatory-like domain-containing protein n=1 Tax=Tenacibaculum aiptasiae TaxID=426481 RepID=A0A7J5AIE8_9FLAO|nr:carboxypeptidase-like regulatory domain-containing protein [Tenacibaculum aiptasiae]KAB1157295.1 carboxypeptidase regulatory-like domain-containing protein [Tenacibaculum aiptasiae]